MIEEKKWASKKDLEEMTTKEIRQWEAIYYSFEKNAYLIQRKRGIMGVKEGMNFGQALFALKDGYRVRRSGWNNSEAFLELQIPDENSKMTLPYIYIEYPLYSKAYPQGSKVPWLASQTDLLAIDWVIV